MDLPVDINKIKKAANDIGNQQNKELIVDVFVDETANCDLVSYVNYLLDPHFQNAHVCYGKISDFNDGRLPDYCVIVAGEAKIIPGIYHTMIAQNVPCALVSIVPFNLYEMDSSFKERKNRKNIIFPKFNDYDFNEANAEIDFDSLNKKMCKSIKEHLADWFVSVSDDYLLSLGYNFAFLRDAASTYYINSTSLQNLGVACIPFLRTADMALMTLNESKMILSLAVLYENEINIQMVPEMILLVLSAFGLKRASKTISAKYPDYKLLISAAFGFGGTQLLGYVSQAIFKRGGSFQNLLKLFTDSRSSLEEAIENTNS